MTSYTLALLPGDGIGRDVIRQGIPVQPVGESYWRFPVRNRDQPSQGLSAQRPQLCAVLLPTLGVLREEGGQEGKEEKGQKEEG